jgi:hypothetical protein
MKTACYAPGPVIMEKLILFRPREETKFISKIKVPLSVLDPYD